MVNTSFVGANLTDVRLAQTTVAGGRLDGIQVDAGTASALLGAVDASAMYSEGSLPHVEWSGLPHVEWSVSPLTA